MWVRTENNGAAGAEAGRRAGPGRAAAAAPSEGSTVLRPPRADGEDGRACARPSPVPTFVPGAIEPSTVVPPPPQPRGIGRPRTHSGRMPETGESTEAYVCCCSCACTPTVKVNPHVRDNKQRVTIATHETEQV